MNTTQAQQKALDDALVAPADRLEFGKCNMRLKTDIKPKEATFQVVLDALALTPFYQAFLITTEVPAIYMQEFWATVSVHKSSIRFTINKKKVSLDVDIFREILQFCPKILGQKFEDLPLEHDILSFIRDLGHSRDIIYLSDVSVDYLHQPWRAFATIINKCLSGKETGMDKIRLSCAQILWEAKKTNKMSYPKFTKIIIDYFMSKDQSISRRNKMFWHTARDDTMFTAMRCISRHEDTQVYGTILPKDLTNQAMLESKAYKTYYAFASGEKTPKPKLKTKAKVAKSDKKKQPAKMPKAKGLDVLSKVPDEQHLKMTGADEGTGMIPGVPYVPIYEYESEKESWGDSGEEDEDDENDSEDKSDGNDDDANDDDNQEEEEEEKIDDEETMDEEDDDEVTKELYDDVNVNLGNEDADMTNADQGVLEQQNLSQESVFEQVEEDAHLLNLENPSPVDNEIASLMENSTRHATKIPKITSGLTTTIPSPPLFFNPLPQQATPTPTTTTSKATTSFTSLPDFSSVFKFNDRVTNLENDLSEIKQVDQYAQALSSIPAIVDRYIDNKLGEAINKAIQAHNLDYIQEAQDENKTYIELVDTSLRAIIKEKVNT
ncbi:hypothetical protein Tco_0615102 [Tanacetum coccineum]